VFFAFPDELDLETTETESSDSQEDSEKSEEDVPEATEGVESGVQDNDVDEEDAVTFNE